jgi:hypothetical protein
MEIIMERKFKYQVIHKPTGEVFAEFVYEIHAKMFYNNFHHIKLDDFMEIKEIVKEK